MRRVMTGQPEVVWMPGGVRTEIHLGAEDTGGAFCLLVDEPPAGWALPPHRHHGVAETIHVVSGLFSIEIGGQSSRLNPGDTVHVPADVIHSGGNVGKGRGRRIVIFSPAGMEGFFSEVGTQAPGDHVDPAAARLDPGVVVGPPGLRAADRAASAASIGTALDAAAESRSQLSAIARTRAERVIA